MGNDSPLQHRPEAPVKLFARAFVLLVSIERVGALGLVAGLAVPTARLELSRRQPSHKAEHGHEVRDRHQPVARVSDQEGHALPASSNSSAQIVKTTITASIQSCVGTALPRSSSYMTRARSWATASAAACPVTTRPTCNSAISVAPMK